MMVGKSYPDDMPVLGFPPGYGAKAYCILAIIILCLLAQAWVPLTALGGEDFLTPEERAWLTEHDGKIIVGNEKGWPPISDVDEMGAPVGIAVDYTRALERTLGVTFRFDEEDTWTNITNKLRNKRIDIIYNMQKNPERAQFALFTEPYIDIPNVIIVNQETEGFLSPDTMKGIRVAIFEGSAIQEFIVKNYSNLNLVPLKDDTACLLALSTGSVDASIMGVAHASYYIKQAGIANLRIAGDFPYHYALRFASRDDWPILNSILEKGIKNIPQEEKDAIFNKWIHLEYTPFYLKGVFWAITGSMAVIVLITILLIVAWNRSLRRLVKQRTQSLEQQAQALSEQILETKQAEAALRESEASLRTLVEATPDLIWLKDPDGVYLSCNAKFERFFGAKEAEIVGKTDSDFVDHDLAAFFRENDLAAMAAGKPTMNEESITYADDGHQELLETIKTPMFDSGGKLLGVLGVAREITQRKRVEEELLKSETQFRSLFENSPYGIVICELIRDDTGKPKDYIHLHANKAVKKQAGFDPEMIVGKLVSQIIQPDDLPIAMEICTRVVDTGLPLTRLHYSETFERTLEITAFHLFENLFIISFSDVSEIKKGEDEIKRLRKYLSNIINSMPSVLMGVDIDGKITHWNKTAAEVTGISPEDAKGKKLPQVYPSLASDMERITESIRTKETIQERKLTRQDGHRQYFEDVTIYPLFENGVEGAVIRIDDVTEKVRMEEMLIQSEKMLSVGGLAAGMAHEINNPLAGIMQMADVMANRLWRTPNMPANIKAAEAAGTSLEAIVQFMEARSIPSMITSILDSGERVAGIVDNMLSFSRKEEGRASSHSLSVLLDKTLELAATDFDLKKHYDFKQIKVKKEYAPDLPLVACESAKIQQVVLNLLHNGAYAMQDGGVEDPCFMVRALHDKERNCVTTEIQDNGPGMDETTRKRIFEPFFTTKPEGVGTGLGLSVSYFIITETHGGEMEVESQPGAGAKFIIRLPLSNG